MCFVNINLRTRSNRFYFYKPYSIFFIRETESCWRCSFRNDFTYLTQSFLFPLVRILKLEKAQFGNAHDSPFCNSLGTAESFLCVFLLVAILASLTRVLRFWSNARALRLLRGVTARWSLQDKTRHTAASICVALLLIRTQPRNLAPTSAFL